MTKKNIISSIDNIIKDVRDFIVKAVNIEKIHIHIAIENFAIKHMKTDYFKNVSYVIKKTIDQKITFEKIKMIRKNVFEFDISLIKTDQIMNSICKNLFFISKKLILKMIIEMK